MHTGALGWPRQAAVLLHTFTYTYTYTCIHALSVMMPKLAESPAPAYMYHTCMHIHRYIPKIHTGALGHEVKAGEGSLLSSYIRVGFRSIHDQVHECR
jgi:hypothetical protein